MVKYDKIDLLKIARRENNRKRSFLLVNPLQAKHIPVSPGVSLSMMNDLGRKVAAICDSENVLVIGFAETATAVGAVVAKNLGAKYIHTTREPVSDAECVVNFQEEHSHATDQALYCESVKAFFEDSDCIVFVDDEITTGKTIVNLITALEKRGISGKRFIAASILNGAKDELLGVQMVYLRKLRGEVFEPDVDELPSKDYTEIQGTFEMERLFGSMHPNKGVIIEDYIRRCEVFATNVTKIVSENRILVIGTEEFMFPAIVVADRLEREGKSVKVHATSRSPIIPSNEDNYPLFCRAIFKSLYNDERITYLYNLKPYDEAIILTDSRSPGVGAYQLYCALLEAGIKKVRGVIWE